jgi:hypothetical protein
MLRLIKIFHTLGAVGLMGGTACCLVLLAAGTGAAPGIDALFQRVLVPSMVVCVLSGWVSMILHRPYWNALWAWLKGVSGMAVLEFTFRVQGLSRDVSTPDVPGDQAAIHEALRLELSGLWVLLGLGLLNVVVGIWRPFRALQSTAPGS